MPAPDAAEGQASPTAADDGMAGDSYGIDGDDVEGAEDERDFWGGYDGGDDFFGDDADDSGDDGGGSFWDGTDFFGDD